MCKKQTKKQEQLPQHECITCQRKPSLKTVFQSQIKICIVLGFFFLDRHAHNVFSCHNKVTCCNLQPDIVTVSKMPCEKKRKKKTLQKSIQRYVTPIKN